MVRCTSVLPTVYLLANLSPPLHFKPVSDLSASPTLHTLTPLEHSQSLCWHSQLHFHCFCHTVMTFIDILRTFLQALSKPLGQYQSHYWHFHAPY
jgi:hypothetical protein